MDRDTNPRLDWKRPYGKVYGVLDEYPGARHIQDGMFFNANGVQVHRCPDENGLMVVTGEPQGIMISGKEEYAAIEAARPKKPRRRRRTKAEMLEAQAKQ